MPQSDYIYIRDEDWTELNRTFRRLNERVSVLEGAGLMSHKYSNTDMQGHKILNGPVRQSTADDQEFITRDFLRSRESAQIISRSIGTGGLSPVVLSPSQPGSQSLGSPTTLPVDMIYGSGDGSVMTDFTIENGLWCPVYNPGGPTLDLTSGLCRVYDTATPTTTDRQYFAGVRSKFAIYPDEAGEIEYRFRISNFSYGTLSNAGHGPIGVGSLIYNSLWHGVSSYQGGGAWINVDGAVDYASWIVGHIYMAGSSNETLIDGTYPASPTFQGTSPGSGEFRLVISKKHSGALKYPLLVNTYFRKQDSDPWVDYPRGAIGTIYLSYGILADTAGLGIFLGGMGRRPGTFDSTISEFTLVKGLAVIGQITDAYRYA